MDKKTPEKSLDQDTLFLAPYDKMDQFLITPFPNGGFTVVSIPDNNGIIPKQLGAFSNRADMIAAIVRS